MEGGKEQGVKKKSIDSGEIKEIIISQDWRCNGLRSIFATIW